MSSVNNLTFTHCKGYDRPSLKKIIRVPGHPKDIKTSKCTVTVQKKNILAV
jgi:hypothetical protein